jgi:hypothetical protein
MNFMELSLSWEAASCAATQEISDVLRNPKFHYRVHKNPTLFPILSQISPVHTTPTYLSKTHFSIIHPLTWLLSFWLAHENPICIPIRPHSCYMPCPSHPPWRDHSNYTWEEHKLWSSSWRSFLQPPVTSSLFGPTIVPSTLFSNTLSLCSSLNLLKAWGKVN